MNRCRILELLVLGSLFALFGIVVAGHLDGAAAAVQASTTRYCGEQRLFGYIRSLEQSGNGYRLRFDPAFFLTGLTANRAAAQDGVIQRGQSVPNDNYVVNESRRTYLYTVTHATRVRVLLKSGSITKGSAVSAETLAQFARGKHAGRLFESLRSGFWLGVHIDHACSLDQQYRP